MFRRRASRGRRDPSDATPNPASTLRAGRFFQGAGAMRRLSTAPPVK